VQYVLSKAASLDDRYLDIEHVRSIVAELARWGESEHGTLSNNRIPSPTQTILSEVEVSRR
jgi:hypothetical protein